MSNNILSKVFTTTRALELEYRKLFDRRRGHQPRRLVHSLCAEGLRLTPRGRFSG